MKKTITVAAVLLTAVIAVASVHTAPDPGSEKTDKTATEAKATPTADEQVASLERMCAENAKAMAARHAEKSFYERLGGEEKIHVLTRELVRLHLENDDVAYRLDGLDTDKVAHRVALFIISGTGGPAVYNGPELEATHAHMELTNADFMAAGGDVVQAMKNLGYGQNEIDEMVCALVSLRDQVVLPEDDAEETAKH
jgi:hemoglobin